MGKILRGYFVPHPPIIIPEVGGPTRHRVDKTIGAMQRMAKEVATLSPSTLVITTPHGQSFRDFIYLPDQEHLEGDFASFGAESMHFSLQNNMTLLYDVQRVCEVEGLFAGILTEDEKKHYAIQPTLDHGALVPLYFILQAMEPIPILYLPMPYQEIDQMIKFGQVLKKVIDASDEQVVFIASGDLSHCLNESAPAGYHPQGKHYDQKIYQFVETLDENILRSIGIAEMHDAAECGTRSLATMWGALKEKDMESEIYSYEGTFGVGYLVARIQSKEGVLDCE